MARGPGEGRSAHVSVKVRPEVRELLRVRAEGLGLPLSRFAARILEAAAREPAETRYTPAPGSVTATPRVPSGARLRGRR